LREQKNPEPRIQNKAADPDSPEIRVEKGGCRELRLQADRRFSFRLAASESWILRRFENQGYFL